MMLFRLLFELVAAALQHLILQSFVRQLVEEGLAHVEIWLGLLQEDLRFEEHLHGKAVAGLFDEHAGDEVFEFFAPLFTLELRRLTFDNSFYNLKWLQIVVGRVAVGQLDRRDAERPDVRALVVTLLAADLGGHPLGRAHETGALVALFKCGRHSIIAEVDVAVPVQQNITCLDVPVHLTIGVEIE
jgi:hypothetical protein